jgi:hypothetical protein
MPFQPPRFPTIRPSRTSGPVLSVGRRVFVNCPSERSGRARLLDDAGNPAATSLPDGAEVEILAWRPRGSGGPRYRVQSTQDRLEGWLAADNLRASLVPVPAAVPAPAADARRTRAPEPIDSRRRFGQR